MKNYVSAAIVELGLADELVLGSTDPREDNAVVGGLQPFYDGATIVELGSADTLVLGSGSVHEDNVIAGIEWID